MTKQKPPKLIVFDGDGTTWFYPNLGLYGSSWDAMSQACGVKKESDEMLAHYYPRRELYNKWTELQADLFKDKLVSQAEEYMFPIPYTPGFRDFTTFINGRIKTALLTVGLAIPAKRAVEECGLDFCLYNELATKNGKFTGGYVERVHLWNKLGALKRLLVKENIAPEEVCYVGDTKGDIPCMQHVGLGIAFNPKDLETRAAVHPNFITENHMELPELMEM